MSRKHRITINAASFLLAAALASVCFAQQMRNITTMELVKDMGLGINLGNTFEAWSPWLGANASVNDHETSWGSPTITREMIRGYKNSGFNTVRVPVAWSVRMTGDQAGGTYTIDAAWMNRVQEVVDWILDEDMYVILNIHWDGGWWERFPTDSTECMRKFQRIWTQVGERFMSYGDRLIFASLNEEGGWNDVWNQWSGQGDRARSYGLLHAINQAFVNLIRSQGGNNPNRHLQVQGYKTDIDLTVHQSFVMPTDPRTPARIAVSVHYYDPFGFTHLERNEEWAQMTLTWGTAAERSHLNTMMDKLKTRFVDNGIPVIIGEYGMAVHNPPRAQNQIREYTLAVTRAMYDRNMLPVLWDIQLNAGAGEILYYYDRRAAAFIDPLMVAGFKEITATASASRTVTNKPASPHPSVTVKGRTLNVSASADTDLLVRMVDVRGKVRATFKTVGGNGSFALNKMPAGRYLVEVRGAGVNKTSAVILK
jgi:endoglucanase